MQFRFAYDDHDVMSVNSGLQCKDVSLAVQSERDDADINTIVRRFGISGVVPQNVRVPLEADFEDVFDFQSAMNAVVAAERSFAGMSADVRRRFANDPHSFVEFCTELGEGGSLKNLDEMRKLGLAVPVPVVAVPGPVVT